MREGDEADERFLGLAVDGNALVAGLREDYDQKNTQRQGEEEGLEKRGAGEDLGDGEEERVVDLVLEGEHEGLVEGNVDFLRRMMRKEEAGDGGIDRTGGGGEQRGRAWTVRARRSRAP